MLNLPELPSKNIGLSLHNTPLGIVGEIILQRETALNAHDSLMNEAILIALNFYSTLEKLQCILLTSAHAKAFCSGGDVRALREYYLAHDPAKIRHFFQSEYTVDWYLANYPVPVISVVDGIAFGGGAGFAIHPRYTVATENAVFAMPETAIGLYPDAGSSHFLQDLPHKTGLFLALTGCRVNARDALYLGLAQSFIPRQDLISRLTQIRQDGDYFSLLASEPIDDYHLEVPDLNYTQIDQITSQTNYSAVLRSIMESPWGQTVLYACQSSMELAWKILAKNHGQDLAICLARELEISTRIAQSTNFVEGVRAMLVDKDRQPQFSEEFSSQELDAILDMPIDQRNIMFH